MQQIKKCNELVRMQQQLGPMNKLTNNHLVKLIKGAYLVTLLSQYLSNQNWAEHLVETMIKLRTKTLRRPKILQDLFRVVAESQIVPIVKTKRTEVVILRSQTQKFRQDQDLLLPLSVLRSLATRATKTTRMRMITTVMAVWMEVLRCHAYLTIVPLKVPLEHNMSRQVVHQIIEVVQLPSVHLDKSTQVPLEIQQMSSELDISGLVLSLRKPTQEKSSRSQV